MGDEDKKVSHYAEKKCREVCEEFSQLCTTTSHPSIHTSLQSCAYKIRQGYTEKILHLSLLSSRFKNFSTVHRLRCRPNQRRRRKGRKKKMHPTTINNGWMMNVWIFE
jgi:hypothetical protein